MAVRWTLTALNVLAVALPLWGTVSAYRKLRDRYRESSRVWERLDAVLHGPEADQPALVTARLASIAAPSSTYHDVLYLRELIAHLIIGDNFRGLRPDLYRVAVGLMLGLVANVWGVWAA